MKPKIKFCYLSESEQKMPIHLALCQLVLGLQTCKTKYDVIELLQDVRALEERRQLKYFKSKLEDLKKKCFKESEDGSMTTRQDIYTLDIISWIDDVFPDLKEEEEV